nr:actin, aortic smooth muscle isoform X2 [Pongo pygmaeus]XP_054295847.1 actin, aortic smooth muscle isoform X2 [Pongo pygmaeus]XP_054295848.1 actin, aortic smooth muscle isoform X2 [Pongo pygmaeus]XP_054295849.1 actin, aortic smooth muscle isoform X2 [Pongo pygmaeus]XP_054295850.1 actin, aortic smooth muscle isoform X2 [Pongo pygmaeus]
MDSVPLVCDHGSGFSKVGFAGMESPTGVFPTVLGKLRHDNLLVGMEEEDWFIGEEVQKKRGKLNLQYPISRATTTNWDNMEKVLFETFNIPALYLANQGVLSLYASGQTSGMTVESGEGMTHFVPIADGCPLHQSTFQVDIAGQDLTLYLLQLLKDNGQLLVGTGDREYIRDMKEKCCYVALDFDKEKTKTDSASHQRKYQLPDGQEITVGQESFFCPEVLFQTKLIGKNTPGIHTMAIQSITSCNPNLQKVLFGHMLLSGGTGSCPGLQFRMQREISELVSPTVYVKVATCPYSIYGAWVGGSILCSLSTFKDMWVTSKEYKEMGSSIISRKSF